MTLWCIFPTYLTFFCLGCDSHGRLLNSSCFKFPRTSSRSVWGEQSVRLPQCALYFVCILCLHTPTCLDSFFRPRFPIFLHISIFMTLEPWLSIIPLQTDTTQDELCVRRREIHWVKVSAHGEPLWFYVNGASHSSLDCCTAEIHVSQETPDRMHNICVKGCLSVCIIISDLHLLLPSSVSIYGHLRQTGKMVPVIELGEFAFVSHENPVNSFNVSWQNNNMIPKCPWMAGL